MLIANKHFPLVGPSRTALLGTLAALVLAANCAGAPGAIAVTGITTSSSAPGGFIYDGTRMWVTDATKGLCRMDPAGGGGGGGAAFTLSNCILPPTNSLTVKASLGAPVFDLATGFVYLPDMSTASKGIWRYAFNGSNFNSSPGVNIAATAGLGALRPGIVTLGDDGNLYTSMTANATFVRINLPAGAAQTVDKMGTTLSGAPARGLAFVGPQLWIADTDGETMIPGAAGCGTKCRPTLNTQVGVPNPLSIAFDAVNSFVYIGTSFGVFQHNRLTGQTVLYSKFWKSGLVTGLLSNVNGLGLDTAGNLYYVDDPTASQVVGGATAYSVPANSLPDGQGSLGSPAPTIPPTLSPAPGFANPAQLYATGLTTPKGAIYMGTHVWVSDTALGFCKVDPTQTPNLTACAVLPAGFVPGQAAYDKVSNQVYLVNTAAALATDVAIARLTFVPATETLAAVGTVTTVATVVTNGALTSKSAGSTAPTALVYGPDSQLYVAMAGTSQILRVTAPAALQAKAHIVTFIGAIFNAGSPNIAFHNSDLWAVEVASASILYNATLCFGNCTSLFFPQAMQVTPLAVTSDGANVYIADGQKVMMFDPIANVYSTMADTGTIAGVTTVFRSISGLASDGLGNIFAADAGPMWQLGTGTALPTITSIAPFQSPEGSTPTVTITGTNFQATSLVVSTCASGAISEGNVTVVSPTQITATFSINPIGPIGACNITVTTPAGASAVSAGSSFTVLIGPPALTSITPVSGFRGRTIPVSIAGANMGLGTISPIAGVTISNTVVNAAGTLTTANLVIDPTAALGPQTVTMSTPSGISNALTFTINAAPPVLTTIAPSTGVASSTVAVTLTGTDLFQAAVNPPTGFTISGVPVVTATSVNVTFLIASTVTAGPQSITVTGPGGTSNAVSFNISPVLTSIAPATAKAGTATTITLTGTGLDTVTSINAGANITVALGVATVNQITATFTTLNSAPLGAQSITVTNLGGTSNAMTFTITAPTPILTGISPISGFRGLPIPVTLSGSGLAGATLTLPTGITLSGTPVVSFSQITAVFLIAVDAPLGAQSITVTTPGGTSTAVTFTVNAPVPTLTTIAPSQGVANTTVAVTLTGTGLVGATVNPPIGFTISGVPVVTATSVNVTFLIASTVAAGPQSITVTTPGGTSLPATFKILPALTSIAPNASRAGAATPYTLTGTSLAGVTSVNAGVNITVTNVVATAGTVTATFTSALNGPVGPVSVTVTDVNGTSNAVTFTLLGPIPVITSISPATGGTGATIPMTITGTGLSLGTLNLPAGVTVNPGTLVASFSQITATLTVAGNAPLGAQSISVTTPGNLNTSNAVTFTVFALAPLLSSISPTTAAANSTVTVTLTGQGFTGTTSVNTLVGGGITVSSFVVNAGGTQITATFVTAANAATQQISVTNPNGISNSLTFAIVPTLTSISPNSLPAGLSVSVTLTGTSLTGITAINANPVGTSGITVTGLTVVSSTQVIATFVVAANATQGNRNITVTTPGGTTDQFVNRFMVLPPPPTITSINSPYTRSATVNNQGVSIGGTNLTGATAITAVKVFLNGVSVPMVISASPVAGNIIVTSGTFSTAATQLKWNQTIPTSLPASSGTNVYTMTVTTPSGTTAPFGFTVQ